MKLQRAFRARLEASSLVEILVSLSLASLIFVAGSAIFLQLSNYQNPDVRFLQRMTARELIREVEFTNEQTEKRIEKNGAKFSRTIKVLGKENNLCEVTVTCTSPDEKELFVRKKIVANPEGGRK